MTTVPTHHRDHKNEFDTVAEPFHQGEGLPFSDVLSAESIKRAFSAEDGLFAQDDIFSTDITLWAFLAQALRDGKSSSCAAAVADISTYLLQTGQRPPAGDTGDYCRARAKLSLPALRHLVVESAQQLERGADECWLFNGLHAKLVDGFTFTMPDTPENQEAFPQLSTQRAGAGFPIARSCAVVSLATACVCDLAIGPYEGKETGESALLRNILDAFDEGDVAVFDRYYCSFMMLAMLSLRGVHACTRLHQRRSCDFRRGHRLGPNDHLITWDRPKRPPWMFEELYRQIPETLTLRELKFYVNIPGRRVEAITVITTLIDSDVYSAEDIATLYGLRWNVELDIRDIKQTLGLDHLRCKTPHMVRRELWVTLLAYNLIRKVIATSAAMHDKQPRRLSFTLTCQTVLASWILLSTGSARNAHQLWTTALASIADHEVPLRPGRIEPRVLKRRRHRYPLMHAPRDELREMLGKT
ncbi:MAG: IS4 family transposase [Candidatus Cloacimonetes bacterium]|nr:IS4 family transposase [Candidatus Cloacimonadota bacterium]